MRQTTLVFFLMLASTVNAMGTKEDIFKLHYSSPQDNVTIEGNNLTWVSTEFVFSNPVSAVPSGSRTVTRNAVLSSDQAEALKKLVADTGFFTLKEAYGAPDNERFYGYGITVTIGDRTKTVSFHSNPSFESAPSSFSKIERLLQKLKPAD